MINHSHRRTLGNVYRAAHPAICEVSVRCVISAEPLALLFCSRRVWGCISAMSTSPSVRLGTASSLLKACVWTRSDLFPCLTVFSHANQSAFNLNIHKPNLQRVSGAGGSAERVQCSGAAEWPTFIFWWKDKKVVHNVGRDGIELCHHNSH